MGLAINRARPIGLNRWYFYFVEVPRKLAFIAALFRCGWGKRWALFRRE